MNVINVIAITDNGRLTLKNYCDKYKNKKQGMKAKFLRKFVPFTEEVDDIKNPSKITVTLSKFLESRAIILSPKIGRSIINVLGKFGGQKDDFEVKIE